MESRNVAAALATLVVLMGCGGGGSSEEPGSGACFELRRGICTEYQRVTNIAEVKTWCLEGSLLGVWIDACPVDHRFETCTYSHGIEQTVWYAGTAQCYVGLDSTICGDNGTFTPGDVTLCEGSVAIRQFACDHRSRDHRCTDFALNAELGLLPALEDACAAMGGTVTAEPCPVAGRVASCTYTLGEPFDPDVFERYYATRSTDAGLCVTRRGTWTAD